MLLDSLSEFCLLLLDIRLDSFRDDYLLRYLLDLELFEWDELQFYSWILGNCLFILFDLINASLI